MKDLKFKIGLKLHSNEVDQIPNVIKIKDNYFDFIELYIIPGSYKKTINNWRNIEIPFVIHAPHSFHGINFARADMWTANQHNFNEARLFADSLDPDIIIVHGGNNGTFNETLRQIVMLGENRIVLENKPKVGLGDEVCSGWSPSEFQKGINAGIIKGTVLDFGHAACVACSLDIDVMGLIREFISFKPVVYHLSDGDSNSEKDMHLNLGKGNLNIEKFISVVPDEGLLTIETPRDKSNGLDDFINDIGFLRGLV